MLSIASFAISDHFWYLLCMRLNVFAYVPLFNEAPNPDFAGYLDAIAALLPDVLQLMASPPHPEAVAQAGKHAALKLKRSD